MKRLGLVFFLSTNFPLAYAQPSKHFDFENTIHGLTTIIKAEHGDSVTQGTGFFFHKYKNPAGSDPGLATNQIDSSLAGIWIITNKHVLLGDDYVYNPIMPDTFYFNIRKRAPGRDIPIWVDFKMPKAEIAKRIKQHADPKPDIVAIEITDLILPRLTQGADSYIYSAVSAANYPCNGDSYANGLRFSIGSTILTIGYPDAFYDRYNLYPTIKTGIIASKWRALYNNNSYFLIDCKLFPGSSGSIVISTPTTYREVDFFHFLGVYSGELGHKRINKSTGATETKFFDTGKVWYFYLIDEIIK
jgi:hypothetical protein